MDYRDFTIVAVNFLLELHLSTVEAVWAQVTTYGPVIGIEVIQPLKPSEAGVWYFLYSRVSWR